MPAEDIPDLQKMHPFSRLSPQACRYLQPRLRRVIISARKRLVLHGEKGSFLAVIGRGQVDLLAPSGKVLTLGPGQLYGVGITFHGIPSSEVVITRSEVVMWVILGSDWRDARNLPAVADKVAAQDSQPRPRGTGRTWRRVMLTLALAGLALVILGAAPLESTHNLITKLALDAGRPDLAETYLQLAAYLQPNYARVYDALGYSLYLQGKDSEALKAFTRAVSLDAEDAAAQNNLGVALFGQAQVTQAIEHMQAAVDLDPGSPEAYFNLGNAYLASGDLEAATRAYQLAYELDPTQLDAKALWAGIELKQNQLDAASQAWGQVIAIDGTHWLAQRGLGVIAVMQGQPEQAVPHLKAALLSRPDDAVSRFYLGVALKELGRIAEADVQFGAALANSSDPALSLLVKSNLLTTFK